MTAVASSCPSCGAGLEIHPDAGVLRCPYCRREIPLQAPPGVFGMPQVTITTNRLFTQPAPEMIRRQKLMALIFGVGAVVAVCAVMIPIFSIATSGSSVDVEEIAVGDTARVGVFEATVRGIDCTRETITQLDDPATTYDESSSTEKAAGKFCAVAFSVTNVGEKTDSYPTYSIEATSPTERVLQENGIAENYLTNTSYVLSEPIDPGKTVDHQLVFDVPADTTLAYLQIGDELSADAVIKVKFAS
ncbi:hypothetical protein Q0Z83_091300 [Actinoplanes sichuanensis]|uniref:DUF4352 domain-containing protein n=1 Tax=Actinoplanes sichuanensis TaxID=512349 RepID=A0ABW4ALT3_9ACTN|nr:DUF4352 domain-containing protein [Actinoplanes sichuanensis]BEL10939.1 hypothetical protein Q0Z83_091300 [Actinoplanes sichuanensis]